MVELAPHPPMCDTDHPPQVVGFDYWQCLSHFEHLRELLNMYQALGWDVHVISAVGNQRAGTVAKEVRALNLYVPVHEVIFETPAESPDLKLAKCKELGVSVFYDDRDDVCRLLNKNGILALRVTRKDNSRYDLQAERK